MDHVEAVKEAAEEQQSERIVTTIGDLVCAISDAARETMKSGEELHALTHVVLMNLLKKYQQ